MNWTERIDSTINTLFPAWGSKRVAARKRMELQSKMFQRAEARMERAWEASGSDRFRGSKWLTSRLSTNTQLEQELQDLVPRAEDLYRKDCFAASAINGRVDNVIGTGYTYQSRIQPSDSITQERAEELNTQRENAFRVWSRIERIPEKQRLAERCVAIYGEAFVVMSDKGSADKPVPLSVQVISPKRVETPPGMEGDPNVRLGIRFYAGTDIPRTYYIRKSHPGDTKEYSLEHEAVPASRVCHVFEKMFPSQVRGVPWLAPVMAPLKDLKDFNEANLISEQIAACFSVFITKDIDPYDEAEAAATSTDSNGQRNEEISPGIIQRLRKGESVTFGDPNRPGNTLAPFMQWHLRGIAAALRYPYELLVKHYENSYSGGRLTLIDGYLGFQCWQMQSIDQCWRRVGDRFSDELVAVGDFDVEPDEYLTSVNDYRRHDWCPPKRSWIDPKNDVEAEIAAIDNELTTKSDSLSARGLDPQDVRKKRLQERLEQVEDDAIVEKKRKELGLVPETSEQPQEQEEPADAVA